MRLLILVISVFVGSSLVLAQGEWAGRDEVFQLEAYARIAAVDEESATLYAEAADALEDGNLFFAKLGFTRVLEEIPGADDAHRGLARIEYLWSNLEIAESHARKAFELRDAIENRAQLAFVLLAFGEIDCDREVLELVTEAPFVAPDNLWANYTLFLAAHRLGDVEHLKKSSARMVVLAPEFGAAHFFHGQFLAKDGEWDEAEFAFGQAAELGVTKEEIAIAMLKLELGEKIRVQREARGLLWFAMLIAAVGAGILLTLKIGFERRNPA
jgi:tetratricopeptide (TPR) repeat protein